MARRKPPSSPRGTSRRTRREPVALMQARQLFQSGRLDEAIEALGAEVRDNPTDAQRRAFLFELLCFAGHFDRAEKQLSVLGRGTKEAEMGALLYHAALHGERLRNEMFDKQSF